MSHLLYNYCTLPGHQAGQLSVKLMIILHTSLKTIDVLYMYESQSGVATHPTSSLSFVGELPSDLSFHIHVCWLGSCVQRTSHSGIKRSWVLNTSGQRAVWMILAKLQSWNTRLLFCCYLNSHLIFNLVLWVASGRAKARMPCPPSSKCLGFSTSSTHIINY